MNGDISSSREELVLRVISETLAQDAKWGPQHYPVHLQPAQDRQHYDSLSHFYKGKLARAHPEADEVSWHDILMEEVSEAFAEADPGLIIEELIQVAALAIQICEDITLRGLK